MSDRIRCTCRRCTIRSLTGPATIITIGVLFLLDQMHVGDFSFGRTFPVILIVLGIISLAGALSPAEGHISGETLPAAPASGTPGTLPQNQMPGQGQGQ